MARFARLRTTGSGFDRSGKNNFDHKISFTFDYSDMDRTSKEVKQAFADFNRSVKDIFSSNGIKSSGSISMGIASNAIAGINPGTKINATYDLIPDGVQMAQALDAGLNGIGSTGQNIMSKYVNRIDTGRMNASVTYKVKTGRNKSTVEIGWVGLWYKYFGFQENGTSRGIKPMHSIIRTYLEILPKVNNYMSRFLRSYTTKDGKGVEF